MANLFPAHEETLAFARVMSEAGLLGDWEYYFEKPYKWETEYNLWVAFGRPTEDNEERENAYYEFVSAVNKMYAAN